jgi:hypothetical protein
MELERQNDILIIGHQVSRTLSNVTLIPGYSSLSLRLLPRFATRGAAVYQGT